MDERGPEKKITVKNGSQNRDDDHAAEVLPNRGEDNDEKIGQIKIGGDLPADDQRNSNVKRVKNDDRRVKIRRVKEAFVNEVKGKVRRDIDQDEGVDESGGQPRRLGGKQQVGADNDEEPTKPDDR